MNETQFIALCLALVASFVWIIGTRGRGRVLRALGVMAFIGAWLTLRLIQRV